MAISKEEVLHVARLARLALTDEEVERLGAQLNAILEAVGKVAELDLEDVEPTAHPLEVVNVWADDDPRPSPQGDRRVGCPQCSYPCNRAMSASRRTRARRHFACCLRHRMHRGREL